MQSDVGTFGIPDVEGVRHKVHFGIGAPSLQQLRRVRRG